MNEYKFDDLKIGLTEQFTFTITKENVDCFRDITGDNNPLHISKDFAISHGYNDRVVYGMLVSSLISTMGGVYLPGRYCLIQQVECKFVSPVYIGDRLIIIGTVKDLYDSVRRAEISIVISKSDGTKVVKALLKVGLLE